MLFSAIPLPRTSTPAPAVAGAGNTALVLQPGQYLYIGLDAAPTIDAQPAAVNVTVHGGYYGHPGKPPEPSRASALIPESELG